LLKLALSHYNDYMEFDEIQKKVVQNALDYGLKFNIKINQEFALLKLVEEIGEFAEAVLTFNGKSRPEKILPKDKAREKVEQELADVIGMAIVSAHVFDIDLEKALHEKWIKKQ